jgi:hypothetical protein
MNESIQWSKNVRIGRCGESRYGEMDNRFCGETLHFREAVTALGHWRESICPICSLKWDIMACSSYKERDKLCGELAEIMRVDAGSAYRMAKRSFWFDGVSLRRPLESPRPIPTPQSASGKPQNVIPYRKPYRD